MTASPSHPPIHPSVKGSPGVLLAVTRRLVVVLRRLVVVIGGGGGRGRQIS